MRLQSLPITVARATVVPLLAVAALAACGSSAKQASTTAAPGPIAPQAPTQSQPVTVTTAAAAAATSLPPLTTAAPPTTAAVTVAAPQTYIVQAGDQLKRIAKKFGVDMTQLMTVNSIVNADKIREGQTLIIPPPTTAPPGVATTAKP